jgi:hypothetical protein|tara:strand:+ start:18248 stop:19504 length:1257 start_codon:yes stop_codon:yes gene_type:complete
MTALAAITSMAQSAKAIGPAFQMAGQMMKQAISDLWTWFKTKFIDPVMNGISEIGDFFDKIMNPIETMKESLFGTFDKSIDKAAVLEEAVLSAFNKEWDQMLHLDERPEWMDEATWQELQLQSSLMADQEWDGMLNLQDGKPDWMTNELWDTLKKKGKDAAQQEWYSYFTPDKEKPDWMDEETWTNLKEKSAGAANQDWDTFLHRTGEKPDWMTDETWENLNTKIATEGENGVKSIENAWDGLITDSDEPDWSKETFWQEVSGQIKTEIELAFEHIKLEGLKLSQDLIKMFTKPFSMLQKMGGGFVDTLTADFAGDYSGPSGGAPGMPFSQGGIATGPATGYPATLHGTEAIVPLSGGRSIPVEMKGGGGGGTVNVVVNASGITDRTDKRQLAREIGNMIQQEMSRSIGGTTMRGRYS